MLDWFGGKGRRTAVFLLLACVAQTPGFGAGLTINVLSGDNAINNIRRGTAFEPEVEIRDADNVPLPGATVTFVLPSTGAGATFTDGGKVLTLQSNDAGRAVARGLRPNPITGPFEIRVTATFRSQTGAAVIRQTNVSPAVSDSKPKSKALIIGLIAAVAAGGVAAAAAGGGGGSAAGPAAPPPPSSPAPGTVTPGTPGFGPPR